MNTHTMRKTDKTPKLARHPTLSMMTALVALASLHLACGGEVSPRGDWIPTDDQRLPDPEDESFRDHFIAQTAGKTTGESSHALLAAGSDIRFNSVNFSLSCQNNYCRGSGPSYSLTNVGSASTVGDSNVLAIDMFAWGYTTYAAPIAPGQTVYPYEGTSTGGLGGIGFQRTLRFFGPGGPVETKADDTLTGCLVQNTGAFSFSQASVACGCAHGPATLGDKLTTGCSGCVGAVCGVDPYCCNNSWDGICANEAASMCGITCGHSVCATGAKLATSCGSCAATVCAADSFCCNNSWDGICVNEAKTMCGQCP